MFFNDLYTFFFCLQVYFPPPDQIIPLITKSFKKTSLSIAAIAPFVIGPFFLCNKQLKEKKMEMKELEEKEIKDSPAFVLPDTN